MSDIESSKGLMALLGALATAVLGLYGWFIKHITNDEAHSIERPVGGDRPVTFDICKTYREDERKQKEKIQEDLKYIRERIDDLTTFLISRPKG